MARPASAQPTDLELEILKILWQDGPSTARHVQERFPGYKTPSASSVHIVLQTMCRKGYLRREKRPKAEGGSHFKALLTQRKAAENMLQYVVRKIFGGRAKSAVQNLLDDETITVEELGELDAAIRKKRQEKKK